MRRTEEMSRLWNKMKQLEKQPVKTEGEFKSKRREMARLQHHYERLAGLQQNEETTRLRGLGAVARDLGESRPEHETRDSLNELAKKFPRRPR